MSNNNTQSATKIENQAQTSSNIEPNYLSNAKVAQFHKTRMCLNMTNCPRQSRCNYAHSVSELRSNLNLSRTKVCKAFQQGKCRKVASQCNFAHGLKELVSTFGYFKTKECPDQTLGCHKGVYCRNYHTLHEREMAEKFIRNQPDQTVGSVKHVEFYNYWAREDPEGLDSFLQFNESKLQNSNSYYRRYRNENRSGDYNGSSIVDNNNVPNYPSIPRPAPLPDSENGPELIPGRLNYAKIASASLEQSSKTRQDAMNNVKNGAYSSNTDNNIAKNDSRTPQTQVKNGPKNHTPMRVNPNGNYGGIPDVTASPNAHKFGSMDFGVGGGGGYPHHHPQYGGYFLPPGFVPGMGSMQGFSGGGHPPSPNGTPQGPPPTAPTQMLNTNVAALNKLNSLSSFNSFGSFGTPDSASNSGPFTHFQPLSGYNMMPRDFSSSLHCSSSGNFQWPQSRSQAPTTTTTDVNDTNTPNQATVSMNNNVKQNSGVFDNNGVPGIHQNSAALDKEH